jgi:hypothetical protein
MNLWQAIYRVDNLAFSKSMMMRALILRFGLADRLAGYMYVWLYSGKN